jgi:hypothetical protein
MKRFPRRNHSGGIGSNETTIDDIAADIAQFA